MTVFTREGISPVVAAVLLVLVAISVGVVMYAVTQGFVGSTFRSTPASSAVLVIESATYRDLELVLYVANRGHGEGVVDTVFLTDPVTGKVWSIPIGRVTIHEGEAVPITVPLPTGLRSGKYRVKVSGEGGAAALSEVTITKSSRWSYVREVTIQNTLAENLNDYQVKIVLNSMNFNFSHAQPDGSDILLYDPGTSSLLPYWIESWDPVSQEAVIWVKVPNIPASSTTTILLYYGNPSATSRSCGPCTFEFFDDFDDGDISDWVAYDATITATVFDGRKVLKLVPGSATYFQHFAVPVDGDFYLDSYVVEGVLYDDYPAGSFVVHFANDTHWWGIELYSGRHIFRPIIDGTDQGWVYLTYGPTPTDVWFRLRVDVMPDHVNTYIDGSLVASWDIGATYQFSGYTKVGFVEHRGYGPLYADYIFVRKYAPSEPIVSVGAESTTNFSP